MQNFKSTISLVRFLAIVGSLAFIVASPAPLSAQNSQTNCKAPNKMINGRCTAPKPVAVTDCKPGEIVHQNADGTITRCRKQVSR